MTRVEANARQLVGWLMPLVDKLHRKCEGNPKVAADIGGDLNEVVNAMMNLGKALDEAGVPKPNIGVEVVTETTRDGEHVTFAAGVRMRPLSVDDEAKLGQYSREEIVQAKGEEIRRFLIKACADNSPGRHIEDERVDVLIDRLGFVIANATVPL